MSALGEFIEERMIEFMHIADPFGIIESRKALNEAGVETQVNRGPEWWMLYGVFTEVKMGEFDVIKITRPEDHTRE